MQRFCGWKAAQKVHDSYNRVSRTRGATLACDYWDENWKPTNLKLQTIWKMRICITYASSYASSLSSPTGIPWISRTLGGSGRSNLSNSQVAGTNMVRFGQPNAEDIDVAGGLVTTDSMSGWPDRMGVQLQGDIPCLCFLCRLNTW